MVLLTLLTGWAMAPDREERCLVGMIHKVLHADEQVRSLGESLRTLAQARQYEGLSDGHATRLPPAAHRSLPFPVTSRNLSLSSEVSGSFPGERDEQIAYNRLVEAKA